MTLFFSRQTIHSAGSFVVRRIGRSLRGASPKFLGSSQLVCNSESIICDSRRSKSSDAKVTSVTPEASNETLNLAGLYPPPGPSKLDTIRATIRGEFAKQPQLHLRALKAKYGDVVHEWVFQDMYYVFDPEIFMGVLRQEWALPFGAAPNTWPFQIYYKHKAPEHMPMMLLQGEEWKTPRQTIQTHMFSPKAADSYQPGINQVVNDASSYLKQHPIPKDLNQFLMSVSFEMLAQVLLDRRMGLIDLNGGKDKEKGSTTVSDEEQFVSSAVDAFHGLGAMLFVPPLLSDPALLRYFPVWNKFEKCMDNVWDIGISWLEQAEIENSDSAFVTKLAGQGKMSRQERLVNLVTILQAGVDTTSVSLSWAVLELARHPLVQERLRQELRNNIPEREDYSRQQKLPYLKAFLREVQRCSPSASGTMRRLPYDVQAGDYVLKKDSIIMWNQSVYSHDAELLGGNPSEFLPERWLAAEQVTNPKDLDPRKPIQVDGFDDVMAPAPILSHPLMTTGFGVGPRMCVGARVAQNEMNSFLSKIVRNFELTLDPPGQKFENLVKLLGVPDPIPRIRFDHIQK